MKILSGLLAILLAVSYSAVLTEPADAAISMTHVPVYEIGITTHDLCCHPTVVSMFYGTSDSNVPTNTITIPDPYHHPDVVEDTIICSSATKAYDITSVWSLKFNNDTAGNTNIVATKTSITNTVNGPTSNPSCAAGYKASPAVSGYQPSKPNRISWRKHLANGFKSYAAVSQRFGSNTLYNPLGLIVPMAGTCDNVGVAAGALGAMLGAVATDDLIALGVGTVSAVLLGPEAAPVGAFYGAYAAAAIGAPTIGGAVGSAVFAITATAICSSFIETGSNAGEVNGLKTNPNDIAPPPTFADQPDLGQLGGFIPNPIKITCCEKL